MKFSGYYKNAQSLLNEQRQRSGSTSWDGQSHLSLTHKLYEDAEQAEFPYYQCWLILRDQPKWSVDFTSLGKSEPKGKFKSPLSWSASCSSSSSKTTPDDSGRQQRDDSPMLFGGGSNRNFVAGGAPKTDDSGRQQLYFSPMLENQTRDESSRTDGSAHHFGGGSNRNFVAGGAAKTDDSGRQQHSDVPSSSTGDHHIKTFSSLVGGPLPSSSPDFMHFFQEMFQQCQRKLQEETHRRDSELRQQQEEQRRREAEAEQQLRQQQEEQRRREAEAEQQLRQQQEEQRRQEAEAEQQLRQQQEEQRRREAEGQAEHRSDSHDQNGQPGDVSGEDHGTPRLGNPHNLIGVKKAKKMKALEVTHAPSPPSSAWRIVIIETGRNQRIEAIPETNRKFRRISQERGHAKD